MADEDEAVPGDKAAAEAQSGIYDQAFFLALAAKGKDAWNAWRRDPINKYVRVTFAGIDFSGRFVNAPLLAALVFKSAGGGS
jgi:hypothetical protein